MPDGRGARIALEAGFLVAVAAVLGLAAVEPVWIVLVMLLAWVIVALLEWAAWRDEPHWSAGLPPRYYVPRQPLPPRPPGDELPAFTVYPRPVEPAPRVTEAPTWIAPPELREELFGWPAAEPSDEQLPPAPAPDLDPVAAADSEPVDHQPLTEPEPVEPESLAGRLPSAEAVAAELQPAAASPDPMPVEPELDAAAEAVAYEPVPEPRTEDAPAPTPFAPAEPVPELDAAAEPTAHDLDPEPRADAPAVPPAPGGFEPSLQPAAPGPDRDAPPEPGPTAFQPAPEPRTDAPAEAPVPAPLAPAELGIDAAPQAEGVPIAYEPEPDEEQAPLATGAADAAAEAELDPGGDLPNELLDAATAAGVELDLDFEPAGWPAEDGVHQPVDDPWFAVADSVETIDSVESEPSADATAEPEPEPASVENEPDPAVDPVPQPRLAQHRIDPFPAARAKRRLWRRHEDEQQAVAELPPLPRHVRLNADDGADA